MAADIMLVECEAIRKFEIENPIFTNSNKTGPRRPEELRRKTIECSATKVTTTTVQ